MGANTKALKARIRSVDSTMHITKAMELVASSKMKRARARMDGASFYREILAEAFADLATPDSAYAKVRENLPALWIVIAGDRGLAGGYNTNVFKTVAHGIRPGDLVLPIGRRAADYYARRGYASFDGGAYSAETLTSADCAKVAHEIKRRFDAGEIGAVHVASTKFVSMLAQDAGMQQLLPLQTAESTAEPAVRPVYEPDAETVLSAIIPEYIAGTVYAAAVESFAAELAARRFAMDTATKNAVGMIDTLSLKYNRARQSAITQEITEIVAGAQT